MARLSVTVAAVCCASFAGDFRQLRAGSSAEPLARLSTGRSTSHNSLNARISSFTGLSRPRPRPGSAGRIYTLYDVSVQETLKGAPRTSVVVAVPGGARGNAWLSVPGAPDLQNGEQLVVFATSLQGATVTPVGTFDGLVRVRQGNGSGATVAPARKTRSLDAFLQEVRAQGGR